MRIVGARNTTPCIDRCLDIQGWVLQSWKDRYSKGVWVALGPECQLQKVRLSTSAGDLDMETATDFLLHSKILPILVEDTFGAALAAVEARLQALPVDEFKKNSAWSTAVYSEYRYFCEELESNSEYGGLRLREPRTSY